MSAAESLQLAEILVANLARFVSTHTFEDRDQVTTLPEGVTRPSSVRR